MTNLYVRAYASDRRFIRAQYHSPQAVQALGLRRPQELLKAQGVELLVLSDSAKINHNGSGILASSDFTDIVLCVRQINKAALELGTSPAKVARATIAHELGHYTSWLMRAAGDAKAFPDDAILNECEAWQIARKVYAGLFNQTPGSAFEAIAQHFLRQYQSKPPAPPTPPPAPPARPTADECSAQQIESCQSALATLENIRQLLQSMQQPKAAQAQAVSPQPKTVKANTPLYQPSLDEVCRRKAARAGISLPVDVFESFDVHRARSLTVVTE